MDSASTGRAGKPADLVDRRRLLSLAGAVGVASVLGGCSGHTPSSVASSPASGPPPQLPAKPVATTEPATPSVTATSAALLCRDAWGARPARPGGKAHTITRMTLHHEAVVLGDNRNAPGHLRSDQRYHQDDHGWVDIAYHVGVDRDGNIYELRSTAIAGDTATDYDTTGHFLVLCEGDFDQEAVTEAQLQGAALAFAWAAQTFRVASGTLAGHRDLAQTSCPGANLYTHLSSGDLRRRIDALLASGPVNLQRICGSEAAAKVAAIEAGN
ncbi:N-acetylmuramoyl-L-alanine amidase [Mycobacterium sp. Marseille-P9652]|uniref:N-acetylmuramoyl-L-alanine amidase n=1 Tax=Mycobacterium sp. Marseille-P9652 TaxID=2654950 RepID=UPI001E38395D|nr:N-acetylmuramoyl-L-alanine amidase [Mycobacterium sp. Marseille-P9652]